MRTITIDKKTMTVAEWAELAQVPASTIHRRLRHGKDGAAAVYGERDRTCASRVVVHKGTMLTLQEWSEKLGVPFNTLSARYRRGWTPREILYGREQ